MLNKGTRGFRGRKGKMLNLNTGSQPNADILTSKCCPRDPVASRNKQELCIFYDLENGWVGGRRA